MVKSRINEEYWGRGTNLEKEVGRPVSNRLDVEFEVIAVEAMAFINYFTERI